PPRWRRSSAISNGRSSRSPTGASEHRRRPRSLVFVGLDEDVDLVGALVVLLIDDRERRGVLADLVVGVGGVLLGALLPVAEVPLVLPGAALVLFDRRGELHLEGRRSLVRLGLGDHVELVLVVARRPVRVRDRGRRRGRRRRLRGGRRPARGFGSSAPAEHE